MVLPVGESDSFVLLLWPFWGVFRKHFGRFSGEFIHISIMNTGLRMHLVLALAIFPLLESFCVSWNAYKEGSSRLIRMPAYDVLILLSADMFALFTSQMLLFEPSWQDFLSLHPLSEMLSMWKCVRVGIRAGQWHVILVQNLTRFVRIQFRQDSLCNVLVCSRMLGCMMVVSQDLSICYTLDLDFLLIRSGEPYAVIAGPQLSI